jgi:hypothetical protein
MIASCCFDGQDVGNLDILTLMVRIRCATFGKKKGRKGLAVLVFAVTGKSLTHCGRACL